jgi:hypothetical protein
VGMERVKKIKEGIWETIIKNQMLPRNTKCNFGNSKFRIELTNELSVFTRQYPIPERILRKMAEKMKEWINNGWVEEVKGKLNEWNSLLFAVLKIFGGKKVKEEIRLCIDFRQVNEKTKSIVYTLSTTVEMFNRTKGAKVFSELDLSATYHQVETESATARMLRFTALNDRQYVWCKMLFGLKGVPTHFQQVVEQVVGEAMEFTRMYVDNFLIHSKLVKEYVEHLLIMIQSLTKAGFRLNVEKCRLGYRKMKFIGNIIDSETKTLEKKKVKSI